MQVYNLDVKDFSISKYPCYICNSDCSDLCSVWLWIDYESSFIETIVSAVSVERQHCKSALRSWSLYMALTSPNWCTEAGAGGNLQECQPSIPGAHLIKRRMDEHAGARRNDSVRIRQRWSRTGLKARRRNKIQFKTETRWWWLLPWLFFTFFLLSCTWVHLILSFPVLQPSCIFPPFH